ncbi:MAG: carbohydrate porin [Puniceicoccales bacterium]
MNKNHKLSTTLFNTAALLAACASSAQSDDSGAVELTSGDAFGGDFFEQDGVTGDWLGARNWLDERGISPYATFTGEFLANVDGGIDDGSAWSGLVDFGLNVELAKLTGWEGGTLFANAFYFHGNDLSGDYVGDFNGVSNIYTDTEVNVFNIFLRQGFWGGRVWAKAGQIAADDDFMIADSADVFVNAAFGTPSFESGNITAPIYPLAAPGALVYVEPLEGFFIQGAIYAGDAGPAQSNNHGFDWRTGGSAGWAWFGETGYHYTLLGEGVIKLGGYYATGDFGNFANGNTESGLGAVYALIDHCFFDAEHSPVGLTAFIRGGITPDESLATVAASITGGVNTNSLFFGDDVLGLGVTHTIFGNEYLVATRAGGTAVTSTETVLECTYQAPVTQWLAIQPDLQYIFDPHYSDRNALVLGVRAELLF